MKGLDEGVYSFKDELYCVLGVSLDSYGAVLDMPVLRVSASPAARNVLDCYLIAAAGDECWMLVCLCLHLGSRIQRSATAKYRHFPKHVP